MLAILVVAVIGCEPTAPPPDVGTPAASAPVASGPPEGTATITVTGGATQIVGTGNVITDQFELAAGAAEMTVSACSSNQVIPFVTLYDAKDNKIGLIVDALYKVKNLTGGGYYLEVAANPDCVWTIAFTPK